MDSSEPRDSGVDQRADLIEALGICKRTLRGTQDARVVATVTKALLEIHRELAGLPDPVKVTRLDDARAEYTRLVAVADVPSQATGTG